MRDRLRMTSPGKSGMSKPTKLAIFVACGLALLALVVFIVVATQFNLLIVIPAMLSAAYLAFWVYMTILHDPI
jgi:Flp pilus assembly protein TadB